MNITETVTVPEREEERVVGTRCDVCNARTAPQSQWPHRTRSDNTFAHTEVELSVSDKVIYGDNNESVTESWDLCPKCFDKHIRPVLDALGAQPRKTESDW